MAQCEYQRSWAGRCRKEAEEGSTNCKAHQKLCPLCRKRLIATECGHTFTQFVCGFPTCKECEHKHKH